MVSVSAAILAGGLGSRLRPVVADRPKVLATVQGRPFLSYLLDQVATAGVRQVVFCTGHLGDQVQASFGPTYLGLDLVYSQEATPLGTAGALRLALPLLHSDPILVMNGDSICEVDLKAFWTWHSAQRAEVSMVLARIGDASRYGLVRDDGEGAVTLFEEKGGQCAAGWINAGIYLLSRASLRSVPTSRAVSLERELFPRWIGRGLFGYRSEGRFLDIGTPESYATAEQFLARDPQA